MKIRDSYIRNLRVKTGATANQCYVSFATKFVKTICILGCKRSNCHFTVD